MTTRDIHRSGRYVVREWHRTACRPCVLGWEDGSLTLPSQGGAVCEHGEGLWSVGTIGPRGGWYGIGPRYKSARAARHLCDALYEAESL